ncbi:MAG: homoserine O-acetyltransferase [Chloroherpetonaceae bacterium]|nr:homoserine O-acetyltransferase [Chloroherpetonaceae bacterium]
MSYKDYPSPETKFYHHALPFTLESGEVLPELTIAYRTWGSLNALADNAILICHGLTGSADADEWWKPLFGEGRAFDTTKDFIVASNVLGGCYGTTGATSLNPHTGKWYGATFPHITIRDMVAAQALLIEALGIKKLKLVIGGSMGGMQVLEWAVMFPEKVKALCPIAVSGRHSAWCIAISEAERFAIYADARWQNGNYSPDDPPTAGLAAARMMAMISYRSKASFDIKFSRAPQSPDSELFAVESYLRYQGKKFIDRFDANTYITLTKAMDTHDLARGRGDYEQVLRSIQQPTLVVSIPSDILYLPEEQAELARYLPCAELATLNSPHGHDAFLIDMEQLNEIVVAFLKKLESGYPIRRCDDDDLAS